MPASDQKTAGSFALNGDGRTEPEEEICALQVSDVNVAAHRERREYNRSELAGRVLWATVRLLFALSPRLFYGWRNFLLRRFGAIIGKGVRIYSSARIFAPWNLVIEDQVTIGDHVRLYAVGMIRIGKRTMISQNAHLCAGSHDYRTSDLELLRTPITVASDVWICADSFIGPGVTIHQKAVVGARSAVFRDVLAETVVGGNPAKVLKMRFDQAHPQRRNRAA